MSLEQWVINTKFNIKSDILNLRELLLYNINFARKIKTLY